ncbi:Rab family GTPase [Acanthamoeba polyphaga moumouvirus]|uniref:Rab family GTPase n=2 Tax=Moumouvirus TaxID=3080801 RepID=L7RBD8_9VIRU|nr:Rab family GTPase [Acanthamoeba polyphaga moumouvirus]AEX63029.1 putative RAB-related GTPase [Moumouvirus Monve]AGC01784.1 Rab family GTPase [Acanthamoeba polyphaga moumouvirus]AQN68133.1 rab family GTPase [Saudi moumouvirus]
MENNGFKVVLIGDSGVGKTSLVYWFLYKRRPYNTYPTIGAAFATRELNIGESKIKLNIWDTAGQERFKSLARMYYNNSVACICVFDVTDLNSFNNIDFWIKDFQIHNTGTEYVIIIVANKCDQPKKLWKVNEDQIKNYCDSINCEYLYTNCIDGSNIDLLFENLAERMSKLDIVINHLSNLNTFKIEPNDYNKCTC